MGRSDIFQVLRVARAARNAPAIISFFIFNILNKIVKKRKEKPQHNETAKLLWSRNPVVASKLLARMFYSNQSITVFVICKLRVNSFLGKRYELVKFLN